MILIGRLTALIRIIHFRIVTGRTEQLQKMYVITYCINSMLVYG